MNSKNIDFENGIITLNMGSGGKLSAELIEELFVPEFKNNYLSELNDQACITLPSNRIAISTDSHVVTPIFFPGGDIGSLSIHGTVNDVAMSGATPMYISTGFILEEGFELKKLKQIVKSMAKAAKEANVQIVTGDTKVVEKGHGDGIYINTTGIGIIPENLKLSASNCQPGDKIIISGSIGDHGAAILSARKDLSFKSSIHSDSQSLHDLVQAMLESTHDIRCLRDPTRGGLGITLNEIAKQSNIGIIIEEPKIPIKEEVKAICEILGFDPLYLANEGKLITICPPEKAKIILSAMQNHPKGKESAIIGEIIKDPNNLVQLKTAFNSTRAISWITGDQLPRIC
jgi:hydrogenase expression/formation protein HypE